MMKAFRTRSFVLGMFIFAIGYVIAIVSYKETVEIDRASGRIRRISTLFPFNHVTDEDDLFPNMLLEREKSKDSQPNWAEVDIYASRLFHVESALSNNAWNGADMAFQEYANLGVRNDGIFHSHHHTNASASVDVNVGNTDSLRDKQENDYLRAAPLSLEAHNEVANASVSQTELSPVAIADWVADIVDRFKDPAWRDYSLQFLGTALERDDLTDSDIRLVRATLDATLANTNAAFAGTALRSLRRAAVAHSDEALAAHVASNALRIARDSAYTPESRTTALLILEESSHPDTLATAQTILSDSSAKSLLRKTAEAVERRLAARHSLSAIESATMSPE